MTSKQPERTAHPRAAPKRAALSGVAFIIVAGAVLYVTGYSDLFAVRYEREAYAKQSASTTPRASLDIGAYNRKMLSLAHVSTTTALIPESAVASTTPKGTAVYSATTSVSVLGRKWPTPTVYPNTGALFPYDRIVAYYGNFYSKQMGVLGEYPPDVVLEKLRAAVAEWEAADPSTPVIPAIDYIAVTAQGSPGADGKYRYEMPDSQIDHAIELANEVHGVVFLDVQVGLSNLKAELPPLAKYLSMPNVYLAIDPEFSMKYGNPPGTVIGTFDASDINYAANYLAFLAAQHGLPPRILVVHRFTYDMVTNYEKIRPLPNVEIVMDMDGWGTPEKKYGTYTNVIAPEPVQFTGFKLFYKNDVKPPSTHMLTPPEVLKLTPAPSFIQYQ
ncbi:MAG: hypothetical protein KGI41_00670 [Patescibacteria group bacterium]|nr:hypothetical protein [Patescibacteria group bacterium]